MTLLTFLCQLISTTTFILMCHLILSKRLPRKITYPLYLYTIFICIFLAPFSGQYGIPIFLLGAIIILLFHKKDRLYNLLFFQILWAWSVLTDYAVTIPLRIAGYDFDVILTSLPLTLLFSILHALLCILPCLFIGNRLHRKLVTDQNVIPPRIQLLLFLEVTICSCIFLINIIFGSLLHYPSDILFFNGILIFCFATANVLIFLMLYNTLQANKKLELQACSVGGGRILVNKVDGIDVSFDGMFNTLVIRNQDENGAVAAVTSVLNQLRINVANMSLCRHKRGGDALMVIETDQHIKPHQVAFLSELTGILSVTYYDKEDDDDVAGFDEGNL